MQSQDISAVHIDYVMQKIQQLSPSRMREVENFIDFIKQRELEEQLTQTAKLSAESSFNQVWDNTEDSSYDQL